MSIESLKQQARKHEQNEDWKKALDQYRKALSELARDDQVDIGLYNRVGDLFVRVGQLDDAVEHYEKAVELYREAYLPNNAIAVCKKVIRNVPDRHRAYLVIGQIRAEQGFLPDARTNFLTYAERMQRSGDMDESFRALVEFCDLAPDDVGVRITVAEQMVANERKDEGVEQMLIVHRHYKHLGETQLAEDMKSRILAIAPDADFDTIPPMSGFRSGSGIGGDADEIGEFGDIAFGSGVFDDGPEEEISFATQEAMEEAVGDSPDPEGASEREEAESDEEVAFDIRADSGADSDEGEDDDDIDPLPTIEVEFDGETDDAISSPAMDFSFDDDEEASEPLPMMDFGDGDDESGIRVDDDGTDSDDTPPPLPTLSMDPGDAATPAKPTGDLDEISFGEVSDEPTSTESSESDEVPPDDVTAGLSLSPEFSGEAQAREEEAVTIEPVTDEAPGAARVAAEPADEATLPESPSPVAEAPEEPAEAPADDGGYIDLGAMILGSTPAKKSTRFTVAYEEPSGDEEADFAKMLSQFKEKVSENLDSTDVRAHHDLGTAYKEMGLLDEAISSFQAALRASADHLPTYELMGQTFIEMGQPEAAVRSLERALKSAGTVEDELVGIYYYLGRAHEALQNDDSAMEFYDRVFALDINFADVTERLRDLR